ILPLLPYHPQDPVGSRNNENHPLDTDPGSIAFRNPHSKSVYLIRLHQVDSATPEAASGHARPIQSWRPFRQRYEKIQFRTTDLEISFQTLVGQLHQSPKYLEITST